MSIRVKGELEIDAERGVVYFHVSDRGFARRHGVVTLLRVCKLPTPIRVDGLIDVTVRAVEEAK
jgi:hypothetical protein